MGPNLLKIASGIDGRVKPICAKNDCRPQKHPSLLHTTPNPAKMFHYCFKACKAEKMEEHDCNEGPWTFETRCFRLIFIAPIKTLQYAYLVYKRTKELTLRVAEPIPLVDRCVDWLSEVRLSRPCTPILADAKSLQSYNVATTYK